MRQYAGYLRRGRGWKTFCLANFLLHLSSLKMRLLYTLKNFQVILRDGRMRDDLFSSISISLVLRKNYSS